MLLHVYRYCMFLNEVVLKTVSIVIRTDGAFFWALFCTSKRGSGFWSTELHLIRTKNQPNPIKEVLFSSIWRKCWMLSPHPSDIGRGWGTSWFDSVQVQRAVVRLLNKYRCILIQQHFSYHVTTCFFYNIVYCPHQTRRGKKGFTFLIIDVKIVAS